MKVFALAVTVLGVSLWGGAAIAGPNDGHWSVRMVTDTGICDASYHYVVAVEQGRVRYLQSDGASISGQVSQSGTVNIAVSKSGAQAGATGRLNGNSGSGTWRVAGGLCNGRWTAHRSSSVQASR